jgi:hypothetical protein
VRIFEEKKLNKNIKNKQFTSISCSLSKKINDKPVRFPKKYKKNLVKKGENWVEFSKDLNINQTAIGRGSAGLWLGHSMAHVGVGVGP